MALQSPNYTPGAPGHVIPARPDPVQAWLNSLDPEQHLVAVPVPLLAELLGFVADARPLVAELGEHMPQLRQVAAMARELGKVGPGGILRALAGGLIPGS